MITSLFGGVQLPIECGLDFQILYNYFFCIVKRYFRDLFKLNGDRTVIFLFRNFKKKNAVSLPRPNKIFSLLFGSNKVVHHDRLASEGMHYDGSSAKDKAY